MRKHLALIIVLLFAIAMIGLGTFAWQSEKVVVTGHLEAGEIILSVDEPSGLTFDVNDLKPCVPQTQDVIILNDANPGPAYLHIDGISNEGLAGWITFDLTIDDTDIVVDQADHMKITDLRSVTIPLGWLEGTKKVTLSFHLQLDTPDAFQGQTCDVNFDFVMTDMNAPWPTFGSNPGIILENKEKIGTNWVPILGDGLWGICRYNMGSLNLEVTAKGLNASTDYQIGLTSPEVASWYPLTSAEREKMASALAAGQYSSPPASVPSTNATTWPYNLFERGYCAPGASALSSAYSSGNVGVYTFAKLGYTDESATGTELAAGIIRSCELPSGKYMYIKVLVKEDGGTYPVVLMEKDTALNFTIP